MKTHYKTALERDANDPLAGFRKEFINEDSLIYLDGNSLGKLPQKTIELTADLVQQEWGSRLIRGWNESWIGLSKRMAQKIAPLVGAQEDEIFVGDSTSLNLYKLVFAALKVQKGKTKIISDDLNFPTDLYVIQGLIEHQFNHHQLHLLQSEDGIGMSEEQWHRKIDEKTALVSLSHVAYKSAFMYPMKELNAFAHKQGCLVLWDLSHSAGAVDIALNESDADLAVGCTYKYLNGGPGAPAFLYVRKDLQEKLINPISSWFGHEKPFDFDLNYQAHSSIQKFAVGTPNILSLAAIEPGLDIIRKAGLRAIREKSVFQTRFLWDLIEAELLPLGFQLASPKDSDKRGSHISIQHPEAYRINRAMIEPPSGTKIMIPDFRPPNNIRLGIAPLYLSYSEIYEAVIRIKEIFISKEYERFGEEKLAVT
jgi:kynureninase